MIFLRAFDLTRFCGKPADTEAGRTMRAATDVYSLSSDKVGMSGIWVTVTVRHGGLLYRRVGCAKHHRGGERDRSEAMIFAVGTSEDIYMRPTHSSQRRGAHDQEKIVQEDNTIY